MTCFNADLYPQSKPPVIAYARKAEVLDRFDPAVIQQRTTHDFTLGLMSMKERALLVRGGLEIQSAPGHGAEIRAWFPLLCGEPFSTRGSE